MKATITFTDKPDGEVAVVLEFQPGTFDSKSDAHRFAAKALLRLQEFQLDGSATIYTDAQGGGQP